MLKVVLVLCLVLCPCCFASVHEALGVLTRDPGLWNCVAMLDAACVGQFALRPLRHFFDKQEIKLGNLMALEKVDETSGRFFIGDDLGWSQMMQLGEEYFKTHAIKFQLGQLEARLLGLDSQPGNFEFSLSRKSGSGKSQKLYRVIIPLVVGFKVTGLIIFGLVAVKLFLIKATFVANTALLVAGGLVIKKLYDHGMGLLTHHHSYLNSHTALPNYYSNSHDFSGYGYHGFEDSNIHEASEAHKTEWPEFGDLHGQFSNHAIAMAALNKTLLAHQNQQPVIQYPKRRWGHFTPPKPWLVNSNWTHL